MNLAVAEKPMSFGDAMALISIALDCSPEEFYPRLRRWAVAINDRLPNAEKFDVGLDVAEVLKGCADVQGGDDAEFKARWRQWERISNRAHQRGPEAAYKMAAMDLLDLVPTELVVKLAEKLKPGMRGVSAGRATPGDLFIPAYFRGVGVVDVVSGQKGAA